MDTDSVKSTLQNLAFGNVLAAAARDYKKVFHYSAFILFMYLFRILIFMIIRAKFVYSM